MDLKAGRSACEQLPIKLLFFFFPGENGSLINNVIHNSQEPGEQFVSLFMFLLWKIIF